MAHADLAAVVVPIVGRTVSRCYVDHGFGIVFATDPLDPVAAEVRIEGSFTITDGKGTWAFSDATPRDSFGPALDLFGKVVQEAKAFEDGSLLLCIGGAELRASSDGDYEPWEFNDSKDRKIVSMPSGGLAIWNL